MGNTAYSLNGVDWIPLPVGPRFGLTPGVEEVNLVLTTERGVRWKRRQFDRDKWTIPFRFTEVQKADFRALHDAVDGELTPFYFTLDYTLSPIEAIYVTKEPGFLPVMLQQPADLPVYDYQLILTGEIDPSTVEA